MRVLSSVSASWRWPCAAWLLSPRALLGDGLGVCAHRFGMRRLSAHEGIAETLHGGLSCLHRAVNGALGTEILGDVAAESLDPSLETCEALTVGTELGLVTPQVPIQSFRSRLDTRESRGAREALAPASSPHPAGPAWRSHRGRRLPTVPGRGQGGLRCRRRGTARRAGAPQLDPRPRPSALRAGDQFGKCLDIFGGLLGLSGELLGLRFERTRVLEGLSLLIEMSRALLYRLCVKSDGLAGLGVVRCSVGDTLHLREVGLCRFALGIFGLLFRELRRCIVACTLRGRDGRGGELEVPSGGVQLLLAQRPMVEHVIDGCGVVGLRELGALGGDDIGSRVECRQRRDGRLGLSECLGGCSSTLEAVTGRFAAALKVFAVTSAASISFAHPAMVSSRAASDSAFTCSSSPRRVLSLPSSSALRALKASLKPRPSSA